MRINRLHLSIRCLPWLLTMADIAAAASERDLMGMSLEELMNIPVYAVSKFPQKKSDAPASVTVITAQEIKDYGYRTLGDILKSVRGLYVDYDRSYTYLGINGLRRSGGDYNGKVLLLIDGYRVNDIIYDQASLGTDFFLDTEMIERVEFVPGAGSSVYGSNAFLGVVNVITKDGKAFDGAEVSGQYASYGTDKERLSFGKRFDSGLDVLLSGSHYDSNGQNPYYRLNREDRAQGIVHGLDGDRSERLFGKLSYGDFTLETGYVSRKKSVPTAAYDVTFDQGPSNVVDQQFFADLRYGTELAKNLNFFGHAYYGRYDFTAQYPYYFPKSIELHFDRTTSQWSGLEARLVSTQIDRHKVIAGVEYQNNFQQDQLNYDLTPPHAVFTRALNHTYRAGIYAQDEYTVRDDLIFNIGLRDDYYSTFGNTLNPRIGAIYKPDYDTALKFLYGTAFRAPNAYELYYGAIEEKPNPGGVKPEKIRTYEIIAERQLTSQLRLTATGHRYLIDNLIAQIRDPADDMLQFNNVGHVRGWGADIEVEHLWDNGARLRASYSWSNLVDQASGTRLVNSPEHVAKLNLALPVWESRFRFGMDAQYIGERKGYLQKNVPGFPVFNLTLTTDRLLDRTPLKGLEVSASVYNLLDKNYGSVVGLENAMNSVRQDGRNFRIQLDYRF